MSDITIDLSGSDLPGNTGVAEIDAQRNAALAIQQQQQAMRDLAIQLAGGDYTKANSTRWLRAVEGAVKDLGANADREALRQRAEQNLRFV